MKNPHLQLKEAIFEIEKTAFETDESFKEAAARVEKNIAERNWLEKKLKKLPTKNNISYYAEIAAIDEKIEVEKHILREYLQNFFAENGRVEIEFPDQEKLDAAFAQATIAHERVYLVYKHTRPELVEDFLEMIFDNLSPEEINDFYKRTARREAEELSEILASLNEDDVSLQP